jgi:hypothetical protein
MILAVLMLLVVPPNSTTNIIIYKQKKALTNTTLRLKANTATGPDHDSSKVSISDKQKPVMIEDMKK